MGVVYLGADKRGQRVALKVIRPDWPRTRSSARGSPARWFRGPAHPRRLYGRLVAGTWRRTPWFATQVRTGPRCTTRSPKNGVLPPAEVATIGRRCGRSGPVHEAASWHRDLKPSNICCRPGTRIIDFGIAWATARAR